MTSLRPEISPLKLWPKWHLRLMLLLYRSHGNCEAQGSFTVKGSKEGCAVLDKGKAATVREGNAAAVSIGKIHEP